MKNRHASGQTLVEVVVVVGIAVLLVLGIVAGTTRSLSLSQTVQKRTTALSLAQEGIELARQERDLGWDAFALMGTPLSTYCIGSSGISDFANLPVSSCGDSPNIDNTAFTRSVTLDLIPSPDGSGNTTMQVTVQVSWSAAAGATDNSVSLTTYLTQWQ